MNVIFEQSVKLLPENVFCIKLFTNYMRCAYAQCAHTAQSARDEKSGLRLAAPGTSQSKTL